MKLTKREQELRSLIADYMWSEGCSCCRNNLEHLATAKKLAKLLNVPKYKDSSGYDFSKFRKAGTQ